jgi:hypothetical protein
MAALHMEEFFNVLRPLVDLLWTSDHTAAITSAYTGQHNTERREQTSVSSTGLKPTISVPERTRPTHQAARPLEPAHTESAF